MPKKAKTTKKNELKQKQSQKQIVNVNINQTKPTTKRKPRENNKPPQRPIVYQYWEPSIGKPSDNLFYNRPPQVVQVIPAMGGETSSLLPPNNTNIENILKAMKDKTEKIMKPSKKLVDSGTQDIFNMEPKKKLEFKPDQIITAPRGIKIQVPKPPPFKLTGEIFQRKNTDMQTEAPRRRPLTDSGSSTLYTQEPKQRKKLTDTGSNDVFNIPSETRDYKSILNAANKEMQVLVKKVEKLSKKKETKPMETQTEIRPITSIETQTTIPKERKLVFNQKKIEKKKQLDKFKDLIPGNLLTSSRKTTNFINVQNAQPFVKKENSNLEKEVLKEKAKSILSVSSTMPAVFKPYPKTKPHTPSLIKRNKKEPIDFKTQSLLNATDINVSEKKKDPLTRFTKISNMLDKSSKSDKNMNDILQGLQMQNRIPDFIKKDTGGILQAPQKQEKSALKIQKVIRGNKTRKEIKDATFELTKPVELFGGTKLGTIFHPEASAPPQPIYGKVIDKSINDNFTNFKKIYDSPPKSYDEVKEAKKQMNIYKQNINRIKKRKGKSILSPDQVQLKEDTLNEIKKLQKTYDKVYKDFYKSQQPKRGRKAKA